MAILTHKSKNETKVLPTFSKEFKFDFAPFSISFDDSQIHQDITDQYNQDQRMFGIVQSMGENYFPLQAIPSLLSQQEWIKEYMNPYHIDKGKPIQWDMMKILDHKCWKCQHWLEHSFYNNFYQCSLNGGNNYNPRDHIFPERVIWAQLHSMNAILQKEVFLFNINRTSEQEYLIDECPCYTESQEYHDWKEQQTFLKVKGSQISL